MRTHCSVVAGYASGEAINGECLCSFWFLSPSWFLNAPLRVLRAGSLLTGKEEKDDDYLAAISQGEFEEQTTSYPTETFAL